eukprot:TRINITY_DN665_c0_g1_i2.p1 TRINITY_DN665_c0_g1~~TRINITY_DN665_c0_g1_i2.p1  ORF type:complete len:224 (-),score=13.54 TRINITY_DN665_c0_g1_i2:911-1582(-)
MEYDECTMENWCETLLPHLRREFFRDILETRASRIAYWRIQKGEAPEAKLPLEENANVNAKASLDQSNPALPTSVGTTRSIYGAAAAGVYVPLHDITWSFLGAMKLDQFHSLLQQAMERLERSENCRKIFESRPGTGKWPNKWEQMFLEELCSKNEIHGEDDEYGKKNFEIVKTIVDWELVIMMYANAKLLNPGPTLCANGPMIGQTAQRIEAPGLGNAPCNG